MKQFILSLILSVLLFSVDVFSNPKSKAAQLCECLKKAQTSQKDSDKRECLDLRETQVVALKKGSKDYDTYINSLQSCESELSGNPKPLIGLSNAEKTAAVCECFKTADQKNRMGCFKLQSDYGKTIPDLEEKKKFNLDSSSCE